MTGLGDEHRLGAPPSACGNGRVSLPDLASLLGPERDATDIDGPLFDRAELGGVTTSIRPPRNPRARAVGGLVQGWLEGVVPTRRYMAAMAGLGREARPQGQPWASSPPGKGTRLEELRPGTLPWEDVTSPGMLEAKPESAPWEALDHPFSMRVPDGCQATRTFRPEDLGSQTGLQCINLGIDPATGVPLQASVPEDYVPTRSKHELKTVMWPRWMERCADGGTPPWSTAGACLGWGGAPTDPGLFWNEGNGFYYRFWLHVVVTWFGFRSYLSDVYQFPAACGMSTEKVRRWFEGSGLLHRKWIKAGKLPGGIGAFTPKAESWLQVQSDGTFLAKYEDEASFGAMGIAGRVWFRDSAYIANAAVCDYYMWWAHRLYSYCMDGDGDSRHLLTAWYCARLAMAEIVYVASVLVHEWGHVVGSSFHCDATVLESAGKGAGLGAYYALLLGLLSSGGSTAFAGLDALLGALVGALAGATGDDDEPQNCCQDMSELIFLTRVTAELGIPKPMLGHRTGGTWWDGGPRLKNFGGTESLPSQSGSGGCADGAASLATSQVLTYQLPGSRSSVSRSIPSACVSSVTAVGTVDYEGVA